MERVFSCTSQELIFYRLASTTGGRQKCPERPPGVQAGLRLIRNPDYSCLSWSILRAASCNGDIAFLSAALTISRSLDPHEFPVARRKTELGFPGLYLPPPYFQLGTILINILMLIAPVRPPPVSSAGSAESRARENNIYTRL